MRARDAARNDGRGARAEDGRDPEGALQPPLPVGHRRAREQRAVAVGKARDRPHPDRPTERTRSTRLGKTKWQRRRPRRPKKTEDAPVEETRRRGDRRDVRRRPAVDEGGRGSTRRSRRRPPRPSPRRARRAEEAVVEAVAGGAGRRGGAGRGACRRGDRGGRCRGCRRGPVVEEAVPRRSSGSRRRGGCRRGDRGAAEAEEAAEGPRSAGTAVRPEAEGKRLPRALRPQKTGPQREKATERKPIVRLEKPEHERGRRQERLGTVVSDAMDKTIVVKVDMIKSHPSTRRSCVARSQVPRARRGQHGQGRRRRPHRRDAPAVCDEALAAGGDRRGCEVIQQEAGSRSPTTPAPGRSSASA